jgi:hypothetical protein
MGIKGYKGFNKDLKCNGFQYEVGKKYKHNGKVRICAEGFHFCENPLHVLRYYNPAQSRFAEVEGDGDTAKHNEDSKVVCSDISVGAEIGLKGIIDAGMKFTFSKVKWGERDTPQTHGDYSAAQTHGDYSAAQTHGNSSAAQTHGYASAAQTHGYYSAAQTHGDYSAAQTHGDYSIACSTGYEGRASGIKGNWLVLAEWEYEGNLKLKEVKTVKVDGKKIKENVFYTLKDGKFVEVKS